MELIMRIMLLKWGGAKYQNTPVLFSKFNNALIGPEDEIYKSDATEKLDYEVELAVVIGAKASKVKKEDALDYIAGYTIGNDISARDLQKRTPQWLQGKSLDHTTPIGPWIVTTSEINDPGNLSIKSYVNGEPRQSSNTKQLIFDVQYLIEFISNLMTLDPGDIILTGTPGGVGMAMNPPKFLEADDLVTLEIDKIGKLENKVIAK
ncbi:fumarylacetoacetate hydrolase family protein [Gracilibacillus boraciitolerans]|uniref:fumarylacetoacetate hydrolase family protein n=1 Tax=Gracilibacillus boraciitolerans TaxID=307521 RepID=UPI0034E19A69